MSAESIPQFSIQPATKSPVVIIEPLQGYVSFQLGELWEYRELLFFLVWRDVKVRYKQTLLGGAWAILQPLLTMIVFSVIFGYLARLPSDGAPYPIFTYTALLPWQLFAHALTQSSNSLVMNRQLITKVYFPRLVIPIAAVMAGLVDFGIGFIVLLGMMFYYGMMPTLASLAIPLFLFQTVATALAAGLWLAALNVRYRDVQYTLPFLTQFWLFITPVAYSTSLVPERWRVFFGLNPMTGVVEGFRWALLGKSDDVGVLVFVSAVMVVGLLLGGLVYFRRMEGEFADVV
jgi:homopolymeric O-antigen transport system permease protein